MTNQPRSGVFTSCHPFQTFKTPKMFPERQTLETSNFVHWDEQETSLSPRDPRDAVRDAHRVVHKSHSKSNCCYLVASAVSTLLSCTRYYLATCAVKVTACDLEKSSNFNNTVEVTSYISRLNKQTPKKIESSKTIDPRQFVSDSIDLAVTLSR